MNATELLAMYERVSDAPDAVPKLRRFVLDLAVRGKLVEQDAADEPAMQLLRRIEEQKTRPVAASERKSVEQVGWARSRDRTDLLPTGWALVELRSIFTSITDGDHLPPPKTESGIPLLVIGNVRTREVVFEGCRYVSADYYERLDSTRKPRTGDLLYTLVGSFGIPIVVRDDRRFCVQRHIGILRPAPDTNVEYVAYALQSATLFEQAAACATGIAQKTVPLFGLRRMVVPLPPLAEQKRIVAKVDQLMALCDQLEAARTEREAARDRLTAASFARLNAPDPDTFRSDARFALNVLPALSARTDQVKQLRQTILNLAVRGKLVPQDQTSQESQAATLLVLERPAHVPTGWGFEKLESLLSEDTRNGYSRRPDDAPNGTPILRISAGTVRRDGVVAEEEHKLISGIDQSVREQYGVRAGDLLACRFNGNKSFVGRLTLFEDYLGLRPIYPDKLIRVRVDPAKALATFIRYVGESDLIRSEVEAQCATTVGNWGISASNLKSIYFPVPPLAQQHQIVAKVDELMALCDKLEASLTVGEATRSRLLEALLHEALEPVANIAA